MHKCVITTINCRCLLFCLNKIRTNVLVFIEMGVGVCYTVYTPRENGKRKEKTIWDLFADTADENVTVAESAILRRRDSSARDAEKVLVTERYTATCFTTFFAYGVL